MNGPDWLASHAAPGELDPETAVLLVEEWLTSDFDGQRRAWQLAHPERWRPDPLGVHDRIQRARIARHDAGAP